MMQQQNMHGISFKTNMQAIRISTDGNNSNLILIPRNKCGLFTMTYFIVSGLTQALLTAENNK